MKNKKTIRNLALVVILAVIAALLFTVASLDSEEFEEVPISRVVTESNNDNIAEIEVVGNVLQVKTKDDKSIKATKEEGVSIAETGIKTDGVEIDITKQSNETNSNYLLDILLAMLPIALFVGFFYFIMKQAQGSNSQAMSFGKSKARVVGADKTDVKFKDVAGAIEAKIELEEIVEFLKHPKKFEDLGAKIPKGVLLFGSPGTGKTMLARAVAGEAAVPFFNISGSEFVEMFVGVGASRVRDLFARAKKNSPCIIFIDEIDAVGRQRGTGMGGGHDEREQTLNQILVEMDGFEQGTNVIVIAATNRPDVLDPALLRPGRFDRRVTLDLPDMDAREEILKVHVLNKPLEEGANLRQIAAKTPGLSGADLANITNEAAILTARANRKKITLEDLNEAVEKVSLGPERKSNIMNKKEKEVTAFHEAGHAIVGHFLEHTNPVHKVSIVSRGGAGGVTWSLPTEDKHLHSVEEFKDEMAMALGGRISEEIIFGEDAITTGASNDLEKVHEIASAMVTTYGMAEGLENLVFTKGGGNTFLGRSVGESKEYSDETAMKIDKAIESLTEEATEKCRETIKKYRKQLDAVAAALIKEETLSEKEFVKVVEQAS